MTDAGHLVVPVWGWAAFVGFILLLVAFDLGLIERRARGQIGIRASLLLSLGYILISLVFAAGLWRLAGGQAALQFVSGYVIEWSLSLDNIFVFVLIFRAFGIEDRYQHRVLLWGVLGALVMRGIFIAVGVALVHRFEWVLLLFGLVLIASGVRLFTQRGQTDTASPTDSAVYRWLGRRLPLTDRFHGGRFVAVENGRRVVTPLLAALLMLELTDIAFAIDSVPAIFSVTRDAFIVFSSNVFAVLGLRALYFAVREVIKRFRYLEYALSVLLIAIGLKLLIGEFVTVPAWATLLVTLTILGAGLGASLWWPEREPRSR